MTLYLRRGNGAPQPHHIVWAEYQRSGMKLRFSEWCAANGIVKIEERLSGLTARELTDHLTDRVIALQLEVGRLERAISDLRRGNAFYEALVRYLA